LNPFHHDVKEVLPGLELTLWGMEPGVGGIFVGDVVGLAWVLAAAMVVSEAGADA